MVKHIYCQIMTKYVEIRKTEIIIIAIANSQTILTRFDGMTD